LSDLNSFLGISAARLFAGLSGLNRVLDLGIAQAKFPLHGGDLLDRPEGLIAGGAGHEHGHRVIEDTARSGRSD